MEENKVNVNKPVYSNDKDALLPVDALSVIQLQGKTAIFVAVDSELAAVIGIADAPRIEAKDAISKLKASNIEVYMLTGDDGKTARSVAKQVGIPEANVFAKELPSNKLQRIEQLQKAGKIVAMVGDGINDSPCLVQADLGIAVGEFLRTFTKLAFTRTRIQHTYQTHTCNTRYIHATYVYAKCRK